MPRNAFLKSIVLNKLILPAADIATRQQVIKHYSFYSKSQWWDAERLLEIQRKNLINTIKIACEQVPFYRDHFKCNGIKPADIAEQKDLLKIPPIGKKDLRNAYPNRCVRQTSYPVQELFTSGSSGQPFAVKIDNFTLSHARALMLLRANFAGWKIGDPFLQTGMSLKRGIVKRIKDILLSTVYVSAFDLSDDLLDHYLSHLDERRIEYVMGYPGSIFFLAQRARKTRFNHRLRGIISWGDNLFPHYRKEMEEVFGCRVTDTYGCGEGIQVASQCEEGRYHIFMPHVLVEVVDEEGQSLPEGSLGEILLTRLNPGAMPLIRYRVGDLGRMGPSSPCACGRGLMSLEAIEGRDTDVVITPRGNRLIVHFFTGIFEYFPSISSFKIIQDRPGEILVQIVPGDNFKAGDWEYIKSVIHEKGDPDLKINMIIVDGIASENSNKRRFVVSRLN